MLRTPSLWKILGSTLVLQCFRSDGPSPWGSLTCSTFAGFSRLSETWIQESHAGSVVALKFQGLLGSKLLTERHNMYKYIYVYIYIHILFICLQTYANIYIYIYIHVHVADKKCICSHVMVSAHVDVWCLAWNSPM